MARVDYPIRPLGKFALSTVDTLLRPLARSAKIGKVQRVLISQPAHHGDVILATSLILPLKNAGYEVGALVGSWAREVIATQVSWTHCVDHWKLKRMGRGGYLTSRRRALEEIRGVGYDVALDLRFHFPNLAPLLWQAEIPVRMGFTSAGFSPLLTHAIPWNNRNCSALESYRDLLRPLLACDSLVPSLPHTKGIRNDSVIFHLGSGDPRREWPLEAWKALAQRIEAPLVFTGKGARESAAIASVGIGKNVCDQLSWQELIDLVAKVRAVITVDTSLGHIAAAVGTPAIVLYREKILHAWKPPGAHALCQFDIEEILNTLQSVSSVNCADRL